MGTWSWRSPHYDCVKCFTLTFWSENSSKVNWALIVPFLPAFYQGLVTFFFVCLCAFPNLFFFSCVCARRIFFFFLEDDKWQKWERFTLNLAVATLFAHVFRGLSESVCICSSAWMHLCTSAKACVCRCIGVNQQRCSVGSGKVWCVRLIEHGRIMTAVYTRSPMSILAHLLALSALADRWKAFSFLCSGKSCRRHLPKSWPWRWTRSSLFEHKSTEIPS